MRKCNRGILVLSILISVTILVTAGICNAESEQIDWPERPIEIVVPFTAGGNVDMMCRIIAPKMEEILHNPVGVVNKPGGGAVVGQTYALNQKADGYTILALTSSFVTNVLSGTTSYNMNSFIGIGEVCFDPELIVVSNKSGINTLEEFIQAAKTRPLTNSTPGFSTSHHMASLVLADRLGLKFEYVHTKGSAEQTVQLAGGHVDCGLTTYAGASSLIKQGKIKVLAICANKRRKELSEIPTMEEKGYDFVYGAFRGLAVPSDTPMEIVRRLSDLLKEVMDSQDVIDQFENTGLPVTYADAPTFDAMVRENFTNMEPIYKLIHK